MVEILFTTSSKTDIIISNKIIYIFKVKYYMTFLEYSNGLPRSRNSGQSLKKLMTNIYILGTALQVRRSRFRFPMVSLEFFIDIILLAALWPWGRLSL